MAARCPQNLNEMLDLMQETAEDRQHVAFGDVVEAVGSASFGPLLLLCGLIIVAPVVGDIPGVPTAMGFVVFLISSQQLLGRDRFWFPAWLRRRSVRSATIEKLTGKSRTSARFVDRFVCPRMPSMVSGPAIAVIAAVSLLIALATPLMELVPFSANGAGAILTAFGLGLVARDGVLAFAGLALTAITTMLMVMAAM
jgi:hypothetical protein